MFFQDLLIGVTSFFRDPAKWERADCANRTFLLLTAEIWRWPALGSRP